MDRDGGGGIVGPRHEFSGEASRPARRVEADAQGGGGVPGNPRRLGRIAEADRSESDDPGKAVLPCEGFHRGTAVVGGEAGVDVDGEDTGGKTAGSVVEAGDAEPDFEIRCGEPADDVGRGDDPLISDEGPPPISPGPVTRLVRTTPAIQG